MNAAADSFKTHSVDINDMKLTLTGSVLHLRGTQVTPQPLVDDDGNALLWNGEVFEGLDVESATHTHPSLAILCTPCDR